LKGLRPGPLDDGGNGRNSTTTCVWVKDFDLAILPGLSSFLKQAK